MSNRNEFFRGPILKHGKFDRGLELKNKTINQWCSETGIEPHFTVHLGLFIANGGIG